MGGLTFGAIGAALIAAVVSLIGLILGKEQKTSEFRQDWINNLRDEIVTYVTNASAISDQVKFNFKDNDEKLKYLAPYYLAINGASNSIKLRLNPSERESRDVLDVMKKVEAASQSDQEFSSTSLVALEDELVEASQKLLKKEWRRVKHGEKTFQIAKYSALLLTAVLACILLFLAFSKSDSLEGQETTERIESGATEELQPPLLPAPQPSDEPVPINSATASEAAVGS